VVDAVSVSAAALLLIRSARPPRLLLVVQDHRYSDTEIEALWRVLRKRRTLNPTGGQQL
jgi:hypothetical protein